MPLSHAIPVLVLMVTLAWPPSVALAGGFTIPLIGSRGSTIGGFGSLADDTSAMYHNVAGLGFMDSYNVDIGGTGIVSHTNYWRCTEATYDTAGNPTGCKMGTDGSELFENKVTTVPHAGFPAGFGILPYLGLTGRFGLKRWNFGLALYSPHNATGAFNDCERKENGEPIDCSSAPQRFHAQLGTINTIYISPSVAFTPHPDISVGLSVSVVRASLVSERSLWLGGTDGLGATLWNGEGIMKLDASAWSWSFNLGVIWKIGQTLAPNTRWLKGLKVGLSFSNMTWFTFDTDIKFQSSMLYGLMTENEGCRKGDEASYEVSCEATVDFTFPLMIRPSFHWQITDQFAVGADFYWQNYSVYEEIRVEFKKPLKLASVEVTENVEPKNSTDAITFSVGAQYKPRWAPGLEFHLGFVFDQSPYPNATYSLLSPDADKYGPVFGVSYQFGFGLQLSAGYIPMFYQDRIVRDSVLKPKICKPDDTTCQTIAPDATFSMNGDVRDKRVDLFTFQVGWRFGRGAEPRAPSPPPVQVSPPASAPAPASAPTTPASAPAPASAPVGDVPNASDDQNRPGAHGEAQKP